MPSPLSPGALHAKIALAAMVATMLKGIENRNRLLRGLLVEPPGSKTAQPLGHARKFSLLC